MALCTVCQGIPIHFFDPLPPFFFSVNDDIFHYRHHTPSALRQSAASGCPMCRILECQLHDHWLSQEIKDTQRLTMKRAIIDSEQAFGFWIGTSDISHNCFFVVPPEYQQALPNARLDENDDEDLLMRHWINDCVESHGLCHKDNPAHCPTRLLDLVRFLSSGDVVLVERVADPDEHITYTTLSHCWGASTSETLITTLANLTSRKKRIRFDELPLTFQDAVTTTRTLKIPYLWIDSLCIIQDSSRDWENEAARMAKVYAASVCTLSALSSGDSNGGFFRVAEERFAFRYDLSLGSQRIRIFPAEPNAWGLDGPLMDRAWTLQERALSNRILHFSSKELLWECKTLKASADLPWLQLRAYDGDQAPKLLYNSAEEASGQHYRSLTLRRHWFGIVQNYCERKLTYSKDKLVALSGLAHYYYEREGQSGAYYNDYRGEQRGKYAAGLWEADMPSALLWRTHQYPPNMTPPLNTPPFQPPRRPSEYQAPSWSWASLNRSISYDSQLLANNAEYRGIWLPDVLPSPRESSEYDFGAFGIQEIKTTTSSLDPMGAVSAGHIILTGLVATAIISQSDLPPTYNQFGMPPIYTRLQDPDGLVIGALFVDIKTEVQPNNQIHCISVRDEPDGAIVKMPTELDRANDERVGDDHIKKKEMVMGLGLARVGEGPEEDGKAVFRRVGLVRWMRKELFVGKKLSAIKII